MLRSGFLKPSSHGKYLHPTASAHSGKVFVFVVVEDDDDDDDEYHS